MPLNLGKTALSAIKLGENALAAIYNGINRVYPNEVTVSIDGANASSQSGSPGTPMNNLLYVVNPSSPGSSGWTASNAAAATLTGLPSGFVAIRLYVSGGTNAGDTQVGTWEINTTDGKFPLTDTSITIASLTSNVPQTSYGQLNTTFSQSSGTPLGVTGTVSAKQWYGQTASTGLNGTANTAYSEVGYLWKSSSSSFAISGTTGGISASVGGYDGVRMSVSASIVINSPTVNATCATSGEVVQSLARGIGGLGINSPPWAGGTSAGGQCYYYASLSTQALSTDFRLRFRLRWDFTGVISGSSSPQYYGGATYGFSFGGNTNAQNINRYFGTGSGNYTVTTQSNFGSPGHLWSDANQGTFQDMSVGYPVSGSSAWT